jgi:ribose 5-phosphate isomerase RpiB
MGETSHKPRIAIGSDNAGFFVKESIRQYLQTFLNTPFAGGRHQGRLDKITAIEKEERDRATPPCANSL